MISKRLLKKRKEVLIIGIVVLLCFISIGQAPKTKIKVKAEMANIYSLPDDKSQIISQVPSGTILYLISKKGEWYQVNLPPDEKAKVRSGYIHQSFIEEMKETKKEKKLKTILAAEEPKYKGEPVSLKCKDADIRDVIRYLCSFGGLNVVFDPEVSGKVTCNLVDVPWDQALDIILKTHKLGKILEGNVLRTGKINKLIKK
jgi:type IV pilus assembly protein PilQ